MAELNVEPRLVQYIDQTGKESEDENDAKEGQAENDDDKTREKRRKLNLWKCKQCREARKRSPPESRSWPQKCQRCLQHRPAELECSKPETNSRTREKKRSKNTKHLLCSVPPSLPIGAVDENKKSSEIGNIVTTHNGAIESDDILPTQSPKSSPPSNPNLFSDPAFPSSDLLSVSQTGTLLVANITKYLSTLPHAIEIVEELVAVTAVTSPVHRDGRRGVRGKANDRDTWAFCDTGAGQNIISARMAKQMGLKMKHQPSLFTMGNSKQVRSLGIVRFEWVFPDDPLNIIKIIAHVLEDFRYDCLLGNAFVRSTKLMTEHIKRFVKGVFPSHKFWSMNLLGETTPRVRGILGNNIDIEALPDIGSSRNIMDESWARSAGLSIRTAAENKGVVVFPDNSTRDTIGQVHTTITLPGGQFTPIVFEILPDCYVPVVLGEDFVFDNDLYINYASAFVETECHDSSYDLLPMAYHKKSSFASMFRRRNGSRGSPAPNMVQEPLNEKEELDRQRKWNKDFSRGRTADQAEWDAEWDRRAAHETRRDSTWVSDDQTILIDCKPSTRPQPGSSSNTGTSASLADDDGLIAAPSHTHSALLTGVDNGQDPAPLQSVSHSGIYPNASQDITPSASADSNSRKDDSSGGLQSGTPLSVDNQRHTDISQSSHRFADYSSSTSGGFGADEHSIWRS
ncbi:hypothetical protein VTL71DRAFT_9631 [Oculimacula yallundae]|uniref:Uncharacterized protein n=1 Tax=Oculimacula yallundae TaxID=86028 RepID=A0ABR4BRD9_9HELO